MCSTYLDDGMPLICFVFDRCSQGIHSGQKIFLNCERASNVHRRWKRVIRGLRHVDMIVRMDRSFASHVSTKQLNCTVSDHFVDVHVRLCSRSGLPYKQRELAIQVTRYHFVGGSGDSICLPQLEESGRCIYMRRGLLHVSISVKYLLWQTVIADGKVDERTLGLRSPVVICRNVDIAHRVRFLTHPSCIDADGYLLQLSCTLCSHASPRLLDSLTLRWVPYHWRLNGHADLSA